MKTTMMVVVALFGLSTMAFAKPADLKKFKDAMPDKAGSANCKTCHSQGKELNDYGKEYKEAKGDFSKMKK